MSQNTVSVIIPCYNGEPFLAEAIESVLSQSYQEFEIIVVDDGSSDNTKGVAARYPSVRYIYQDNQGVSGARNRGMAESQGSYLSFLDSDDRLLPNTIELGVNYLDTHPDCGFVFGWWRSIGADGSLLQQQSQQSLENVDYQSLLEGKALVPPSAVMFRRTIFETVGGFNPTLRACEDYDLYLRIYRAFPIYCLNQVVFDYRRHEQNWSTFNGPKLTLENNLRRLDEQLPYIKGNKDYEAAYRYGKQHWRNLIGPWVVGEMVTYLKTGKLARAGQVMLFLLQHYPLGFIKQVVERLSKRTKRFIFLSRSVD